jgi:uncharacterized protein YigE (DUF2233 family)
MHRTRSGIAFALVACALGHAGTQPILLDRLVSGPGLALEQWYDADAPWKAFVAQVDLSRPELAVEVVQATGRPRGLARPSSYCRSNPATVVAINGDYFDETGLPVGLCVDEGRLVKTGRGWSYLALLEDPVASIHRGEPVVQVLDDAGDTLVIARLNPTRPPKSPYLVGLGTAPAPDGIGERAWALLELEGPGLRWSRRTKAIVRSRGPGAWPDLTDSAVLLVDPPPGMRAGAAVELLVQTPQGLPRVRDTVGGGPRIVRAGSLSVEYEAEGTSRSHALDRHPRTAVGVSRDGTTVWLAVVDGRQPGHSRGADLYQLGEFMLGLGCWDVLNLDGGGSSVMVYGGSPLNSPSDAVGERAVSNLLAVMRTGSPGDTVGLRISKPAFPLACSSPWQLSAWWLDDRGWLLGPVVDGLWICDRSLGAVSGDGYLFPEGEGWLRLRAGALEDSVSLSCRAADRTWVYPPLLHGTSSLDNPVVIARDGEDRPLTAGRRVLRGPDELRVDSAELGRWTICVVGSLSWHPIGLSGPRFVRAGESVGLPYGFSDDADTTWFSLVPKPEAASLRLRLRGNGQGVHTGVAFVDSLGHSYRGELTSASGGGYWDGWRRVSLDAADCTSGAARPATPPLRLQALFLWPGTYPARAGTLWIQSLTVGAPHRGTPRDPGG